MFTSGTTGQPKGLCTTHQLLRERISVFDAARFCRERMANEKAPVSAAGKVHKIHWGLDPKNVFQYL